MWKVALFEGSDRARLQVYRALHKLSKRDRHRKFMIDYRAEIVRSALTYRDALDLRNLDKRLKQLDQSLDWIVENHKATGLSDDMNVTLAVRWRACEAGEERVAKALSS